MLPYPKIDPILIELGPVQVRWYGLMYVLAFFFSYLLVRFQLDRQKNPLLTREHLLDLYLYLVLGLLLGARLGYALFYNLREYIQEPWEILAVWHGGMSFHGGLLGVCLASWFYCQRRKVNFLRLWDLIIVTVPLGLGLGRLGNFINGELYGRITAVPWGMIFPQGGPWPRHPSQLYEALLEGGVLFAFLWRKKNVNLPPGRLGAYFLILYGAFRFSIEFFREPDPQLGYLGGLLTMGQILSLPMILAGLILAIYCREHQNGYFQ